MKPLLHGLFSFFLLAFIASPQALSVPANDPEFVLPEGGSFNLEGPDGQYSLDHFADKVVFVFFGYTSCPDVCPTALSTVSMALKRLPESKRDQVQILFISVDPKRDTPEHLKDYTAYFDEHIMGLTGSREAIDDVVNRYRAKYKIIPVKGPAEYLIDHSAYLYAVDRDGKLMGLLRHQNNPKKLASTMAALVEQTAR